MQAKTLKEFKAFLKEYKVVGLAIAFVMGKATNDVVQSLVDNIFMPLINPLIPGETWETATLTLGGVSLGWGAFLSSSLNFLILAFVVFLIVKKLLKEEA